MHSIFLFWESKISEANVLCCAEQLLRKPESKPVPPTYSIHQFKINRILTLMLRCSRSRVFLPFKQLKPPKSVVRFGQITAKLHYSTNDKDNSKRQGDEKKDEHGVSKRDDENAVFKVKSKSSPSAPAPMSPDLGIESLMKKDNKPYIPKLKHDRLTYEYPGLPNEDDFTKHTNKVKKPKTVNRWSRHVPKLLTAVVVLWGAYTVKVWYFPLEKGSDSKELLDPNTFHKFVITHKLKIDDDHYLIEVRPKFKNWQYSYYAHYENKSIWNGDKIWSVEVKQPQIMVVRSYTPLPLYFMKSERTRSGEKEPLLRVIENDAEDYDKGGVMTFYIKRYGDGEVSRYIVDKAVGDEIDIRGPHIEYTFPHHPLKQLHERPLFRDLPSKVEAESLVETIKKDNKIPDFDNLDFYAAGTGIAPALQVLFSRNPYRGYMRLHYSSRTGHELGPLERFLFFLEKLDRVKLIRHIDEQPKTLLNTKNVPKPKPRNYISPMRQEIEANSGAVEQSGLSSEEALKLRISIMDESKEAKEKAEERAKQRATRYENALQQAAVTSKQVKAPAGLAIVCGPDGYVDYVAGGKLLNTNEQGEVKGLLGDKSWDSTNVYKL